MSKALELAKFGRESPPAGAVVGDSDTQTLSSKTFSDGPVFSALTANGVPFLNASKVLSSSSTFIFDGTNLGIGVASPAYMLHVKGGALAATSADGTVTSTLNYNSLGTITNSDFVLNTNSIERARISSTGLQVTGTLSAGNTTLTGTNALTVNRSGAQGQITLQNNGTSTGILIAGATNGLVFYDAAAGLQMGTWAYAAGLAVTGPLSATGNLNITSPAFTDSIAVINSTSTNVSQRLNFTANGTLQTQIYDDADQTIISTVTSKPLIFKTANTERLRIGASGVIQKPGTNGGFQLMDGNTAGGVKIGAYTANFLADGYLAFEGYSIEYGRFSSTGNFGIGTQSSDYRLTVARGNESTGQVGLANFRTEATGSATYNAGVQIFGTASATAGSRLVSFVMDADGADAAGGNYFYISKTGGDGRVDLIQASNAPMGFAANYVGRGVIDMTLSAAGNLGLGTTPSTGAKFQVTGFTDFWNTTNTLLRVQHDGSRGKLQSYTGGGVGSIALNPEGGNVGIGTDNPTFKLDVNARMRVGDGTNNLVIGYWDTATNRIESSGKPLFLTSYTDSIRFGMSGGEQMRLNSNGNLAIGTTGNTAQKLNVNGALWLIGNDDANYSTVIAPRYDSSHPFTIQTRNNDSTLVNWLGIYSDSGGANNRIVLGAGGWPVVIGATSSRASAKLDIRGDIMVLGSNASYYATIDYSAGTGLLSLAAENGGGISLKSGATERVRITPNGNVGIGTTNPTNKLEITATGGGLDTAVALQTDIGGGITITSNASGQNSRVGLILRGSDSIGAAIASAREDSGSTWNTYMAFYTNWATGSNTLSIQEKMRLTSQGRLGIGTTTPEAKLEIKPAGNDSFFIGRFSAGAAKLIHAYQAGSDGYLEIKTGADVTVTKLSGYAGTTSYFTSPLAVGHTSAAAKLHVGGTGAAIALESFKPNDGFARSVEVCYGQSGTFNVLTIEVDLAGAGGYCYELNSGGTSGGFTSMGGGYMNTAANFSHSAHTSGGSGSLSVSCPSGHVIRFVLTGGSGVHPVCTFKITGSLNQAFTSSNITVNYS